MRRPPLVTLTTDIGSAYAAQMKAVLAPRLAAGTLVDLSHDLRPHAIGEAAFLLRAMAIGFPPGTIHVAVVDPGVGGRRAAIVVACRDGSRLVGPDNGVLAPLADALGVRGAFRVDPARLGGRGRTGTTFDGRDVFAPVAARLARGDAPARFGPPIRPRPYTVPEPRRSRSGVRTEVVHEDRFGNLVTNAPTEWVPAGIRRLRLAAGRRAAASVPFVRSYEELGRGRLGVLGSSFGLLEVSVAEGSAAGRLRAGVGTPVRLDWAGSG
jgi:S-adenosyl-L-methionine hydrolase (adenosine-forming)